MVLMIRDKKKPNTIGYPRYRIILSLVKIEKIYNNPKTLDSISAITNNREEAEKFFLKIRNGFK